MSAGRPKGGTNRPYDERLMRFILALGQHKKREEFIETVLLTAVTVARCLDVSKRDLKKCLDTFVDTVYETD